MNKTQDLICYRLGGMQPDIRPAPAEREWMDATAHRAAYRCLPMTIANAHGWELINPSSFEVTWNGSPGLDALTINPLPGATMMPLSHFGSGVITWHVNGLFRTPPGYNLYVTGSPNRPKDGISPLTGVIETDWANATFTMNWIVTRPNHTIRFDAGEPICFFFPIPRRIVDNVNPQFRSMSSNPEMLAEYQNWSVSRDKFNASLRTNPPANQSDGWQKDYMKGNGGDHQTKIKAKSFANGE
jgi:hypothetical protein